MYNTKLHFHFIGIGGVGMSAIAEILLRQGFRVSGSDLMINDSCLKLKSLGADIFEGHSPKNLQDTVSTVVFSSAVSQDNPEIIEAKTRSIPVLKRAEVLAELMRMKYGIAVAGSHGKTTTTSIIGHILDSAGFDPTVIIGGALKKHGASSGKLGDGDFLVAESDESDKSFLLLKPSIAIVTNIDAEHLSAYSSMAELEQSFFNFINSVPFYGLAVICVDDPKSRKLAEQYRKRKITYGLSPDANIRGMNLARGEYGVTFDIVEKGEFLFSASISLHGSHNILNSLAAVCVAKELGIGKEEIAQALKTFPGVKRRLEVVGKENEITVISDYAHHPTEIKATLAAIRPNISGRLIVVFQPHRYSRTKECFGEFVNAFDLCDHLVVTDIYPAGENPIPEITSKGLFSALSHPSKEYCPEIKDLPERVHNLANKGDAILCMGAGTIGKVPYWIIERLRAGENA
ncbi:MAG: UDP-N-acetylmuramate--L-alanine ligase [Candidatus Dadabacteria bacterium]|nr:MAG: UDP-N-acetylmuramate--L-alanine ligase [Candidatus Dadabacteria bacterium]